jgi:hypothetical protein
MFRTKSDYIGFAKFCLGQKQHVGPAMELARFHFGWPVKADTAPRTFDEFAQCANLIEVVPEIRKKSFVTARCISRAWAYVIDNWGVLVEMAKTNNGPESLPNGFDPGVNIAFGMHMMPLAKAMLPGGDERSGQ